MAEVRLSDVIIPEVFTSYFLRASIQNNTFFQSGIAEFDALFVQLLAGSSKQFELPHWKDLEHSDDPNLSGDDPTQKSTPKKIGTSKETARRISWNQSWSSMDFTGEIAGSDPFTAISARVGLYWSTQYQKLIVAVLKGILADNIANDSKDMVHELQASGNTAPGEDNMMDSQAFIDAEGTMGDFINQLSTFACHSVVYNRLLKSDLITFEPYSEQGPILGGGGIATRVPTFRGYPVIVNDNLPTEAQTYDTDKSRTVYTSVLFAPNVIALASAPARVPTEIFRNPDAGNGGGQETLYTRLSCLAHPRGWQWKEASVAGSSPTFAEIATAGNWDRIYDRKLCRMAFVKTNG